MPPQMSPVKVQCDRCKKWIFGSAVYGADGLIVAAVKFFVLHGAYQKIAREGEKKICDSCMWGDPKFER